ncbi:uncharacterized protein LOC120273268 [Dioscorea cayenensis subsp. rotundata]|uniref:Uncharacterized protein LOC120273268 n=1 Tax=Dioscorea cayennensis subsp. rotundata TaxID=55577 RepID=A0AB40C7K7_DIOCR|nr:uncharacterized protein LOC120273268 [Dioscorea cayenensis subsp. rotundata]
MEKHPETSFKVMNQDFMKLDRFDGTNYTRWKDKMMFFLTALKIWYVLDPSLPKVLVATPVESAEAKEERVKHQEDELLCRGHILNTLSDRLYYLFTFVQSPREIWKALEFKYNTEKQGADKFITMKFLEFIMFDHVSVLDQVHELQILVSKLKDLNIEVSEALQVRVVIAKLPPSWNDYRKKLLHSSESFSLEQLHKHLRIEEETSIRDGKRLGKESDSNVNFIDVNKSNRFGKKRKFVDVNSSTDNIGSKKNKTCFIVRGKDISRRSAGFGRK